MDKYSRFNREQILYILLSLAVFAYFIMTQQYIAAALLIIALIVIFLLLNKLHIFKRKSWDKFINDSINKLKPSLVEAGTESVFPIVSFTRDGTISWYNKKFGELSDGTVLNEIEDVMNIDLEKVWKGEVPEFIGIKGRVFKPEAIRYTAAADEFEEDLIFLHLTDYTVVKKAEDSKIVTILAEVDNLNEVLNSAPDDKKPFVAAAVEKILLDYTAELKGFMKRYSNNKALIIVPFEVLRDEVKKKFPILDRIKNIDQGNTLEPTLSMGVSYDNGSVSADGDAAGVAKELALGRGGDQVVIKTGEKLSFFGGNSREMEKKSKVRSRVVAHALRDLMLESQHIYIMGHGNPDMDSLGGAIGIHAIARSLDKPSNILMDDPHRNVSDLMSNLMETGLYDDLFIPSTNMEQTIGENDLLVVVDVHSLGYVLNSEVAKSAPRKVVIDHHRRAQDAISGVALSYIEAYASSTSELVTELVQYTTEKPELNKAEADALLSGILVDTKNFNFKTGVRTFEAASFLRKAGANTLDLKPLFAYDKELYLLKAAIVKSAEVENGVAIATCPTGIKDSLIAAQAADEFMNIKGIHTSFVLIQVNEDVVISARSLGDMNVQVIMEEFGGGGHLTMSGARVKNDNTENVKVRLKKILEDKFKEDEEDESDTSSGR
ncbi:MAG: DHH family phosphoesterase [Clostridiaceae bacterium]